MVELRNQQQTLEKVIYGAANSFALNSYID